MAKILETDLDFQNLNRVTNMVDPVSLQDGATKNYVDNFKLQVFHEHFFGNLPNSWGTSNSGTGTATTVNSITNINAFGIIQLSTGTTATGRASINTGQNMTRVGGSSVHSFGGRFKVPVLSVATQRFTIRKGLTNAVTGTTDPTDGIYLRYTDNLNAGQIQLVCRRASVETVFNTAIAVVTEQWINWRIEVNAALTQVDIYCAVDNNQPAFLGSVTSVTSIPLNTTVLGFWNSIIKSVGTTARLMHDDLVFYDIRNIT